MNSIDDWIKTDGGIDFKNLSFNLNKTTINGQGFLGIDYNDNFLKEQNIFMLDGKKGQE